MMNHIYQHLLAIGEQGTSERKGPYLIGQQYLGKELKSIYFLAPEKTALGKNNDKRLSTVIKTIYMIINLLII